MRLLWLSELHMGDLFHALIGGSHQSQIWGNRREAPVRWRTTVVVICVGWKATQNTQNTQYTSLSAGSFDLQDATDEEINSSVSFKTVWVNISSKVSHFMWLLFQIAHRNFPASSWISHWSTFIYTPLILLIQSGRSVQLYNHTVLQLNNRLIKTQYYILFNICQINDGQLFYIRVNNDIYEVMTKYMRC